MKKVFRMMGLIALVAIAATSCKKDQQTTSTLKATLTQPTSDAKTHLDGSNLVWNEGDAIKVFDNQDEEYLFTTTDAGQATANFTSTASVVVEGSKAFYPAANAVKDGNYVRLNLANSQDYDANSFANGTYPMSAAYNNGFTFSSPCGLLAIPVIGSGSIGSIELTGKNGESLAGDLKFSLADGSYQNEILAGQTTVTLNCGGGVGLDTENATVFYFALPAGVFTGGFTAVLKDVMGNELRTLSTTKDNHITAQRIRAMDAVSVGNTDVQIVEETATASVTEPTQCTLTGTVTYTGTVDAVGFYYGLSAKGTKDLPGMTKVTLATVPASGEQFEYVLTGLQESTSYQYCIYVKTGEQETYGTVESFTTSAPLPFDPYATELTFEAKEANATVQFNPPMGPPQSAPTVQYRVYDSSTSTWTDWADYSSTINLTNVGDMVSFRGDNATNGMSNSYGMTSSFSCTGQCYLYGNIMSLLYAESYPTKDELTADYAFAGLFFGNSGIYSHPEKDLVLPATTLTPSCYQNLFGNCTHWAKAPALPATTMANHCYYYMFQGCTNLTTAPALPATTLAEYCYYGMFSFTGLTAAPALPAQTLASNCYAYMFQNCSGLTTAPALPAQTMVQSCYNGMFTNCSNLNSITCLATSGINENSSTSYWVSSVAATGTFTRDASATWPEGNNGIPAGWTVDPPYAASNIIDLSTVTSDITVSDGKILINTLGVGVQISIADGATVTLQDANINGSDNLSGSFHGIKCLGDATIILEGDNIVKAKNTSSSSGRAGIFVPRYKKLIIQKGESDGMLDVAGAGIAAGIGGYMNNYSAVANGAIEIQSGKMTVTAGSGVDNMMFEGGSAGIGSCPGGRSDAITITKGNFIVYGAEKAAAIGTGATGYCKQEGDGAEDLPAITINIPSGRGWVKAYKGDNATYIIGGGVPNKCGVVTVHNQTYEDGGGNHGITGSTTSQSPFALDIYDTYILYMP